MTSIHYFWLKTNYRVYLCCLEFLSGFNYPSFFLGASASEESIKVAKIAWRFLTFQPSRNDQAIFSDLKDTFSAADRRFRSGKPKLSPTHLSSFSEPSAVLSETMTTKPA